MRQARKMKKMMVAVVSVAAVGVSILPAVASTGDSRAACYVEDTIVQTYGLTDEAHPSNFRSLDRGILDCQGTWSGAVITGPGWFRESGHTPDTYCLSGTGTTMISGKIPTTAGDLPVNGKISFNRVGLAMTITGTFTNGAVADGTLTAQPRNGSCTADDPVTEVTLRGVVAVR